MGRTKGSRIINGKEQKPLSSALEQLEKIGGVKFIKVDSDPDVKRLAAMARNGEMRPQRFVIGNVPSKAKVTIKDEAPIEGGPKSNLKECMTARLKASVDTFFANKTEAELEHFINNQDAKIVDNVVLVTKNNRTDETTAFLFSSELHRLPYDTAKKLVSIFNIKEQKVR